MLNLSPQPQQQQQQQQQQSQQQQQQHAAASSHAHLPSTFFGHTTPPPQSPLASPHSLHHAASVPQLPSVAAMQQDHYNSLMFTSPPPQCRAQPQPPPSPHAHRAHDPSSALRAMLGVSAQ